MRDTIFNTLIVGVGGQGVLLASELISHAALSAGHDVKQSEIHGMSQRGGTVSSHVRFGPQVFSPTIEYGQADYLVAFEQAEALRSIDWLKKDGLAVVSTTQLVPAIVTASRKYSYPQDAVGLIRQKVARVIAVPADDIAAQLGNPRLANTILLGVLSNHFPLPRETWIETIRQRVKAKLVDINIAAFERGREMEQSSPSA